jgi:hypothetical protein
VSHSRSFLSFRNTATSTFTHNRLTERPIEHLCPTQPSPTLSRRATIAYPINALQLANDSLQAALGDTAAWVWPPIDENYSRPTRERSPRFNPPSLTCAPPPFGNSRGNQSTREQHRKSRSVRPRPAKGSPASQPTSGFLEGSINRRCLVRIRTAPDSFPRK